MVVLVLTPNRTGSSTVARLLHEHFNILMGEKFLVPTEHNPAGVYEDAEFSEINKLLMWDNPVNASKELRRLIGKRQKQFNRWGVKAGVLAFLLGYYLEHLDEEPVLIRCRRNMHDTCKSWSKTWGSSYLRGVMEVYARENCLDRMTEGHKVYEINFDKKKTDEEIIEELSVILLENDRHGRQGGKDAISS